MVACSCSEPMCCAKAMSSLLLDGRLLLELLCGLLLLELILGPRTLVAAGQGHALHEEAFASMDR